MNGKLQARCENYIKVDKFDIAGNLKDWSNSLEKIGIKDFRKAFGFSEFT